MIRSKFYALAATAGCALAVALSAPASASPEPPCSDLGALAGKDVPLCHDVTTDDGVRARVRVGDVVCVRADALTEHKTADARVLIPCPVGTVPVPVPVPVPAPDAPVMPPTAGESIVVADLPVTG